MRIRRKKWAEKELNESRFYIHNPNEYKGRWNDTADEGDEEARLSDFAFIMEQAA